MGAKSDMGEAGAFIQPQVSGGHPNQFGIAKAVRERHQADHSVSDNSLHSIYSGFCELALLAFAAQVRRIVTDKWIRRLFVISFACGLIVAAGTLSNWTAINHKRDIVDEQNRIIRKMEQVNQAWGDLTPKQVATKRKDIEEWVASMEAEITKLQAEVAELKKAKQ